MQELFKITRLVDHCDNIAMVRITISFQARRFVQDGCATTTTGTGQTVTPHTSSLLTNYKPDRAARGQLPSPLTDLEGSIHPGAVPTRFGTNTGYPAPAAVTSKQVKINLCVTIAGIQIRNDEIPDFFILVIGKFIGFLISQELMLCV